MWSDDHRLGLWHEIEALAAEAWESLGKAPAGSGEAIRSAKRITPEEVAEREQVTHHDVAAFIDLLTSRSGPAGRWVHYGLTSSDVLDTATAVQLVEAANLLDARLVGLFELVRARALGQRQTVMIGRTHGMWAEPTTLGLKLAGWAFELARDHDRLLSARGEVAFGKMSGAVGTYAHAPTEVETFVCARLGLSPEAAATQVTPRDRHARFLQTLALIGASVERFAIEIRHLARSEVGEAHEPFEAGQKGSSAMPHKQNPVVSERVSGLARLLRGYAQVGLENVALWHERDISHSSAERVVFPDACLVLDYMLATFTDLIRGLRFDTDRMRSNLEASRGLPFSQAVLYALIDRGYTREDAYRIVQRDAAAAFEKGQHLLDVLAADPETGLTPDDLASCFSSERLLARTSTILARLEALRF